MRIKEEFKKAGYFWLPLAPEKKIPGTLSISDGGNIELEVVGLFDEGIKALNSHDDLKRIVGHIEKDGLVTLDDCFYKKKDFAFGGISKSLVHVNRAFSGVAYEESESVSFNTFQFSVKGIDEWVGISGIKVDNQYERRTTTITYLPSEEISLNLNNGMQLLITFSWTLPGFPNATEAKITQKTYFKLASTEERELNNFISIANKITTLLCFAIEKTVCLEHVTATSYHIRQDIGDGNSRPAPIHIYYSSLHYSKDEPKIDWHLMLFRYGQIQNDAEKIINNWIDAYDKIGLSLNLYFSTKTGAHKYLDGKFLALAQGLETFHRRTSNEKLMDDAIFKRLTENIIKQCPDENKTWLSGRLQHGNELNLRRRIKRIIEPFKELIGTSNARDKLIRAIVVTRNYLTHYDNSSESEAATGRDLWLLCLKMEAIFQLHILQVLGFTHTEVKSVFDNSHELQQKLKEI